MPHVHVYIHLVFSTKQRFPYLTTPELRKQAWKHMYDNARSKGIYIDFINGYTDHCHILLSLGTEQTISKIVQLIKGESAFWINKNNLCATKFEWQNDYFAASVSESAIERVRQYISKQEEHHKTKTFA